MERTSNLEIPYILPGQARKHVTHNEAVHALDAVVQLGVLDRDPAVAPSAPSDGDRYLVAAGASGDRQVAAWQDGAWEFHSPRVGWLAWIEDENVLVCWNGSGWGIARGAVGRFDTVAVNGADWRRAAVARSTAPGKPAPSDLYDASLFSPLSTFVSV